MIGKRVGLQLGSAFVVARVGVEDVRLAQATAKMCEHPMSEPAGVWLVITLRPPSGLGARYGIPQ